MKINITFLLLVFSILINTIQTVNADTYVRGYYRSNGTYVQPHYRSDSDGDRSNNYSSRGNVNPYTGQIGTKNPYDTNSNSYNNNYYHSNRYRWYFISVSIRSRNIK